MIKEHNTKIKDSSELINELGQKGYFILRNILNVSEIEQGKSCIKDNTVLYTSMIDFVQNIMIAKVNKVMGWSCEYVKFRVSDNNNSSDASAFHRDIICQNPHKEIYPVYTLLSYLDRTVMEIIPTSQACPVGSYSDSVKTYQLKEQITMNPGDLMLFGSTILHRGIFTDRLPHRRLIQVFEIFPNKNQYDMYAHKFLHIPSPRPKLSNLSIFMSKFKPSAIILNIYGYLNALTGYGHHMKPLEKYNLSDFTYLASEGLQGRISVEPNKWQTINKYVLNKSVSDFPETHRKRLNFIQYTRQHILYSAIIISLIIVLVMFILVLMNFYSSGY